MDKLKFSPANAKTHRLAQIPDIACFLSNNRKIYSLDLLSGWSCPYAHDCLSKVYLLPNNKRKLVDGKHTQFRCFSASQEATYTNVYNSRLHNFKILRSLDNMPDMLSVLANSIPKNLGVCRIHVAGDFFNQTYFDSWLELARAFPNKLFYAYTKSLKFWLNRRKELKKLPNFVLTASYGGRDDKLIGKHRLRNATVVFSENEAKNKPIDHDDSHAANPALKNVNFALLLHGVQPANTKAATALKNLKGKGSYAR